MGSLSPTSAPFSAPTDRESARIQAFKLALDVQAADAGAPEAIERLLEDARRHEWPEVVRAALFAGAVAAAAIDYEGGLPALGRLLEQAEADGDSTMVAIALAMRSSRPGGADRSSAFDADADLARATVLLESGQGDVIDRMTAHNECAQAYCDRWLWELGDEQFALALSLTPPDLPAWLQLVLPAIVYNRAEMQVDWASAQFQLGDLAGVAERWQTWNDVIGASGAVEMPEQWRTELNAFETLLGAIAGLDNAEQASALLSELSPEDHVRAWPIGHLQLAIALSDRRACRLEAATEAAEAAISNIDPHGSPDAYDLALSLAAEIEAESGPTAGLRYARRQLERRSANRVAALGAMRSRLLAERLHREHDLLSRHAHLDDLTGLSNRRGFERYLADIANQRVDTVALFVADLDDFKAVNDRYGHATGDAVLIAVARVIEASVRKVDCAVRLGGDEFAVVLASADVEVARLRVESVMETIGQQPWEEIAAGLNVSLSVGLTAGPPADIQQLITLADAALYEAKAAGGRRVVFKRRS